MNPPPPNRQQSLAARHQALLQLASQERAALSQASGDLAQPLRRWTRVLPALVLGYRLARWWRLRKI
jgi:hypothetical protein